MELPQISLRAFAPRLAPEQPPRARRLAGAALLSMVAWTTHGAAPAQAPAQPTVAEPEQIIVTARRRDEQLSETAAAVSVLAGREMVELGINQVDRLGERLPALTVQPTATGNLMFIRGVGNFTLLPNSDPAVGFASDGVFFGRPMGTMSQFFDLDRIELVKGPQGVLYGRNASAGSINLEPRQPVYDEYSALAHLSLATYDEFRAEAAVNAPLGPAAAFRLSGARSGQDHFLEGYTGGPTQHSLRAQVKTSLSNALTVRLSGDYNHVGGVGVGTSYVGNYVFDPTIARYRFFKAGLPLSMGIYSPEGQAYRQTIFLGSAGRTLDAIASRPEQDHEFYGAHARIESDLGIGVLTVIPAWREARIDAIVSGSPFGYRQLEAHEQTSLEARLAGRRGAVEWLAGAFLFDEEVDSDTTTNLSSALIQAEQRYWTSSRALFGNLTLHASRRTRLSGGLRWTRDRKEFTSDSVTLAIVCQRRVDNRPSCRTVNLFPLVEDLTDLPFPVPAGPGAPLPILVGGIPTGAIVVRSQLAAEGELTDRAVTWRIGGEADIGTRSLVYATLETGYRPGGFNTAVGFETYDPERITAWTLGLRHRGTGGRLDLDVEAFWWNYRDQQVSSLRPDLSTPPRNANITENIGKSRIRGVEADVRYRPWRGAEGRAIIQHLDADYRSFEYVYANTGVPPLTGCAATLNRASNLYTIDCSRKQPYNSPRWTLSLSARQSFVLGRLNLTAAADIAFRSGRNIGFAFLPEQRIGSSSTSNLQLILRVPGDRLEAAAFVRNIEGDRIPQFMIYHPVSNALVAGAGAPRQFGVRASLRL